jgi:glycosyltransferase involved in cell wall biosynthesis
MYGAIIKGAFPVDLSWMESAPNVAMLGKFKSLGDLPIADYDSYVFTTSAEGLPVVLLEMTALGLPIIAPDVGGIGEFVDSTTGWLVSGPDAVDEYVSAIAEIEDRPDLVAQKIAAARQRLETRHSFLNFSKCVGSIPGYIQRGE